MMIHWRVLGPKISRSLSVSASGWLTTYSRSATVHRDNAPSIMRQVASSPATNSAAECTDFPASSSSQCIKATASGLPRPSRC